MKLSKRSQVIFLLLWLLPAAGVFAATDSHKGSLTIGGPVQVAGKQLPAGEYLVKWDGTGPTAQVNIIRNGKVVATAPPLRRLSLSNQPHKVQYEAYALSCGLRGRAGSIAVA